MTKKKLSFKKWLSMLLTAVMLVAALPISAFAAPASGIPANMLDNVYLDALAYTGYNVQAQKDDGTIFIKTGSSVSASIRSGIGYGTGPVSYTHLDVYKRQTHRCSTAAGSGHTSNRTAAAP